jgi:hypothetical protein
MTHTVQSNQKAAISACAHVFTQAEVEQLFRLSKGGDSFFAFALMAICVEFFDAFDGNTLVISKKLFIPR